MARLRPLLTVSLLLAGVTALAAPALPALLKYGAWPHAPQAPVTLLLAGATPKYDEYAAVWPWPAKPEDFSGITDTIVLAQLRPGGEVKLLSIPRDTWMNIPGWGYGKINGANSHGGARMLVGAVQRLTGLHVDAYGLLSLNALRDLTQAAGGVNVNVPERMKYDDAAGHLHIDLYPGPQRLNGPQAEGFLRFRHDALGDIGRVARQQQFLTALAARLRSPMNAWRLPAVVAALDRNTKSDLGRQHFAAALGTALSRPKISAVTLPGAYGPGGTWTPDTTAIRALMQSQFSDPGNPRAQSVALVNVDAPPGTAARLKTRLEDAGYTQIRIVNEDRHRFARTAVSGDRQAAQALLADVGYGTLTDAAPAGNAALTVRLGADAK